MGPFKYLIIGGGASGTSAAEAIRKEDASGTIAIISDEVHPLYSRVMLSKPNFFLGKIPFDQVWLKGEDWYKNNSIVFIGGKVAVSLDEENKIVTLGDGRKISYEKLLIATGVCTRHWDVPGADKRGVYSLRTLEDGKAIMEAIKTAKRAITVGGGFISFEMADLLKLAGLDTTMLLRESYFWEPTLDEASGKMIEKALDKNGIKIIKNAEVTEVVGGENVEGVVLKDGTKIDCEMIITGIGVTLPNTEWLKQAGINIKCGILTNEYLETGVKDVWAVGDIAEYKDILLEENVQLGNWVNAREQGRIAGLNMCASFDKLRTGKTPFKFVSFYTTQGVGISIAFVGDVRPLPNRIIIERGSSEINSYARILIVGNPSTDSTDSLKSSSGRRELVGATMINRTSELTSVAKLIEKNVDISAYTSELSNPNFDLKQLLPK
jgi:nitrite reductase (NADH) large subunit